MDRYPSIGLQYTLTCPLACRHCITNSSPQVRGKMTVEEAKAYLSVLKDYTASTCFTGGEPLLHWREIVELIRYAGGLGLRSSLVTGAGWVKGRAAATRIVKEIAEAGLDLMCISWDVYHEEFNPRQSALTLAQVATEAGLKVTVRSVTPATVDAAAYRTAFAPLPVEVETTQIIRLGRASTLPRSHFQPQGTLPKGPCGSVLSAVIEPDGMVYACCGPSHFSSPHSPLVLGDAKKEPLEAILERGLNDPILEIIALLGPYGLYRLLQEAKKTALDTPRKEYDSICDLCLDLTNSPEIIAAIREQVTEPAAQAMLAGARLWMTNKLIPEHKGSRGRALEANSLEAPEPQRRPAPARA